MTCKVLKSQDWQKSRWLAKSYRLEIWQVVREPDLSSYWDFSTISVIRFIGYSHALVIALKYCGKSMQGCGHDNHDEICSKYNPLSHCFLKFFLAD